MPDTLLLLLLLCSVTVCFAQPYVRQVDGIPVTVDGNALPQPFAGGINAPKHEFADIDGDGDYDLFILDNDNYLDFYRNNGTAQIPDFRLCRVCVPMPKFLFWFLFVDLNGDGKLDLCTDDSSSGVRFFRNDGTILSPDFTLQTLTMLDSAGNPMNAGFSSVPAFADIDGDSVLDFLSSNSLDGSVNFYKNIGTTSAPLFKFVTGSFQGITVIGDTCFSATLMKRTHHGAGVLTYVDIDNNGTKDMFYGDLFSHGVFEMQNTGTTTQPHLVCATNRYPDPSLLTLGFNQPGFVDIDGDGDLDMFVGVLNNVERHGFWLLRNEGTSSVPDFQVVTKDYLSTIDVGANAGPAFVDIDGNGTLDLFVGSLDGRLWYFKNTGTPASASLTLLDSMFAGISGNYVYSPVFADIDADGDKDLLIGRFDGKIVFYRNTGSATAPQFVSDASPADTIGVLQNASPALADFDGDGDLDLFIGKGNGQISYYRNDGDSANFNPVVVTGKFADIDVGEDAKPIVTDIDRDGDPDLVIGNADGKIAVYKNVDGQSWALDGSTFAFVDPLREAAPALADIDGDGDPDLFVGTSKGGMQFYRNEMIAGTGETPELPRSAVLFQNYPNPFNPATTIAYELPEGGFVSLKIFDLFGREVTVLQEGVRHAGIQKVSWNGASCASGVYYYRLITRNAAVVQKMLLLK